VTLLRPATDADVPAIGRVHIDSRIVAYAGLVSAEALHATSAEAMAAYWAERWHWERESHRLTVAVADDEVVGFTYTGPSETPDAVELYAIHVLPAYQGAGVGRDLLADASAALGPGRAVLWVLDGNAQARRFYERNGWAFDGETRQAPIGPELTLQLRYAKKLGGST
jgi:GNAT superfamily N-acetyltransferase